MATLLINRGPALATPGTGGKPNGTAASQAEDELRSPIAEAPDDAGSESPAEKADERTEAAAPSEDLAAKYATHDRARMLDALDSLRRHNIEQANKLLAERMESGKYDEKIVPFGEPGPTFTGVANSTQGTTTDDGKTRYRWVTLEKDRYPAFYAEQAEIAWLERRLQETARR